MTKNAPADLLEKLLPTLGNIDSSKNWHIVGSAFRARKCDIYKLSNTDRTLALKVYKSGVASDAAPRIQYEALRRCNEATQSNPLLQAPQALAFLAEQRAILMEWQSAPTLRATLWRKFGSPDKRFDVIKSAGAWLRAFHELSGIGIEPLDAAKLSTKLNTQIKRKPRAIALLKDNLVLTNALTRFHATAANFNQATPHALLHGDFTPTNLLVDGTTIIGMDIWGARHGPIYEDIARILTYLGVVSPFALDQSPLKPVGPLVRAFLSGYGEDQFNPASRAFLLILLYQQMRRWLVYADKKISRPLSPLAHWQYAQNRRLCLQTLTWLEHCSP